MPTHMPVLVDFWAIGSGSSAIQAAQFWANLTGGYGVSPTVMSFSVPSKYADGALCTNLFTYYDSEGRITLQIAPSAL